MVKLLVAVAVVSVCAQAVAEEDGASKKPVIKKLGAIDCDMVETTPVVFNERLYRFEYVRDKYYEPNKSGDSYFRFVDVDTGDFTPSFAQGFHLGSAFVDGETMYVFAVEDWGASKMSVFWSADLEHWESKGVLDLPGWEIFNNSVCFDGDRYVMAFEIGAPPEETGAAFTSRFATSQDLKTWALTPPECVHTKAFYSACPSIRFLDGYYYNVYLKSYPGYWAPHITRSKDLITWEESPLNPVMKHGDDDKQIANPNLTPAQRERIAGATNVNNSDVDFCEFNGKTVIYYSWGNQHGIEHLAEAVYDGPEADFLRSFFPVGIE